MSPLVRRTWAPRGHTPVLYQRTRSYKKVSAIAALTLSPHYRRAGLYFSLHTDANITAERIVRFLRSLGRQVQKPMLIVWDRLVAHRAGKVKTWLDGQSKIYIEFFPPYAPELNPVERVWGYLKGNSLANWSPKDAADLTAAARYYTGRLKRKQKVLRSLVCGTPLFLCRK